MEIIIVMPVYEDWESAAELCSAIDETLIRYPAIAASLLLVDDGSSRPKSSNFVPHVPRAMRSIQVLRLRRNLGHQRAIAVALAYVQQKIPGGAVLIMDADGEDRPEDIPRLLDAVEDSAHPVTVFAERGRRIETASFKVSYGCYRLLHRILTGRTIRFGNFSLLPHIQNFGIITPRLCSRHGFPTRRSGPIVVNGSGESQK
jgi:glycosyltransferase involved in cell wall biosynthesis